MLVDQREGFCGGRQARRRRTAHQRIGARIVAGVAVAVEQHRAEHQLAARLTTRGGFLQPRQRLGPPARLIQRQGVIVAGQRITLQRGLVEPILRQLRIDRHAAPKLVGEAQVELRIGVAGEGGTAPLLNRAREVAPGPGVDPGLHICLRRRDGDHRQADQQLLVHQSSLAAIARPCRPAWTERKRHAGTIVGRHRYDARS